METVLLTNIKKLYDNELYSSVITSVSGRKESRLRNMHKQDLLLEKQKEKSRYLFHIISILRPVY